MTAQDKENTVANKKIEAAIEEHLIEKLKEPLDLEETKALESKVSTIRKLALEGE